MKDDDARRLPSEPSADLHDELSGEQLLLEIAESQPSFGPVIDGVVIGTLAGVEADGAAVVDYPGNPRGPLAAASTVAVETSSVGRRVALSFERGQAHRPIVIGFIAEPRPSLASAATVTAAASDEPLVISLDRDVELRVGRASISLTRDGKIMLRGDYILSRAEGTQQILGGTVTIN